VGKIIASQVNMFYKKLTQVQESKATWLINQFFWTKEQSFSSSGGNKLYPGIFQESHWDQDLDHQVASAKNQKSKRMWKKHQAKQSKTTAKTKITR